MMRRDATLSQVAAMAALMRVAFPDGLPDPLPDPKDLNDRQRLAVALAAGCETELALADDGASYVMRTKRKIGIVKIGQQYRVYENV